MSFSSMSAAKNTTPVHIKYKRIDKDVNTVLLGVLDKFSVAEQVDLRRNAQHLPKVLMSTWRDIYKCLDFESFQRQLMGDALLQFLRKMRRHFRSVRLNSGKLQDQLNTLHRCGISEMPGVRECQISWNSANGENYVEWPLQSLPNLLPHLQSLELCMPIEVEFIEQFGHLKILKLNETISDVALLAVWSGCPRLQCLQILGPGTSSSLIGICQCTKLQELTLPMAALQGEGATELLKLPDLKFLELQQKEDTAEAILEAISMVITDRGYHIKMLEINGRRLGNTEWLSKLALERCPHLDGLRLFNCQFGSLDMSSLKVLPVLNYAAFCQCPDLKDNQVVDFVKACPVLSQLDLSDCPELKEVLHHLFQMRSIDKLGTMGLYLKPGESLTVDYKQNLAGQSSLELLETPPKEAKQMQHVQFIFLNSEVKQ